MWYTILNLLFSAVIYFVPIIILMPFRLTAAKKFGLFLLLLANMAVMTLWTGNWGIFLFIFSISVYLAFIEKHWLRNVILFLVSYLLNVVLNNIESTLLWLLFGIDQIKMISDPKIYILFFIVSISLTCISSKLLSMGFKKNKGYAFISMASFKIIFRITLVLLLTVLLCALNIIEGEQVGYSAGVVAFNTFIFIVYFGVTIWIIISSIRIYQKESEMQMRQSSFQAMQKYIGQIEKLYGSVRAFRHDYANIMMTMYTYIEERDMEGLEKYFSEKIYPLQEQMTTPAYELGRLSNLKLPQLKGLVTAKLIYAQEMGISVSIEAQEPVTSVTGDVLDLARILGIFLDNAIEAALETEAPQLSFAMIKEASEVVFRISNSFLQSDIPLSRLGEAGVSTKGKNRGVGLYNARQMINHNENFYLDTRIENERFVQELHVYVAA